MVTDARNGMAGGSATTTTEASRAHEARLERLLDRYGSTFAERAGITVRDEPAPLFQLLVLVKLLSARIRVENAVDGMRGLLAAGWTTPERLGNTTWQQRVDVLNSHGYARYDESASRMLDLLVHHVGDAWHGDLRELHAAADGDEARMRELLQDVPGIGPVGAVVFLREVQGVWADVLPFVDDRASSAARDLGLPHTAGGLLQAVGGDGARFVRVVASLVQADLDDTVDELRNDAGGS